MDGLWVIVDSLSVKNKKWLSKRLLKSIDDYEELKEKEILESLSRSLQQAKEGNTIPLDSIWNEL